MTTESIPASSPAVLESKKRNLDEDSPEVIEKCNITPTNQVKKKKQSKTKGKKLPAFKPPPPISKTDHRRTYTYLILNTFNSCDSKKLNDILCSYTVEDLVEVHRYDGVKNPYGREYSKVVGRDAVIQLWNTLFRSAPDFFYDILDSRCFYSPDWQVYVASRFSWSGTRIADVRIARTANERVLQKKLFESSRYITDENELLKQLLAEKSKVLEDLARAAGPAEKSALVDESLFYSPSGSLETSNDDKFYLDSTPLPVRKQMRCTGTLLLALNGDNKIEKMEFVFKAVSESEELIQQAPSGNVTAESQRLEQPETSDPVDSVVTEASADP